MPRLAWRPATLAALAACLVAILVDGVGGYLCAGLEVEATAPGDPPGQAHCAPGFSTVVMLWLVPPAVAGVGVLTRRPWLAWGGAAVHAAGVGLLFFAPTIWFRSAAAVVMLAALAWWQMDLLHARAAAPTAGPGRRRRGARILVVATATGLGILALAGGLPQVADFWDPCHEWGQTGAGMRSAEPGGPCSSGFRSSALSKTETAWVLTYIFGVPLLLCAAALWASRTQDGALAITAGALLAMHAVPLLLMFALPAFPLTWTVAVAWIVAGVEWRRGSRPRPRPQPPAMARDG